LLDTLKREKLVLDWRKRQQSRAAVKLVIDDILDGLPEQPYPRPMYAKKCDAVYRHVYDSYYGENRSVYATVH
jgi:type I restriction enzyme R subunit